MIVGVYIVSRLYVKKTRDVAIRCGQRFQYKIVFQTFCSIIIIYWGLYSCSGVSSAIRCCSFFLSLTEIRTIPENSRGQGCSRDPRSRSNSKIDTEMVNTPSTVHVSVSKAQTSRGSYVEISISNPKSPSGRSASIFPMPATGSMHLHQTYRRRICRLFLPTLADCTILIECILLPGCILPLQDLGKP